MVYFLFSIYTAIEQKPDNDAVPIHDTLHAHKAAEETTHHHVVAITAILIVGTKQFLHLVRVHPSMGMMLARTFPPKVRVGGTARKLVVEDEQRLQLRVSLKVLIYFVLYHNFQFFQQRFYLI